MVSLVGYFMVYVVGLVLRKFRWVGGLVVFLLI